MNEGSGHGLNTSQKLLVYSTTKRFPDSIYSEAVTKSEIYFVFLKHRFQGVTCI